MIKHTFGVKALGVTSIAVLVAGIAGAPALAAGEETATATYTCLGSLAVPVTFAVDAPPTTMVAGQKAPLATTSSVKLGPAATSYLKSAGWATLSGAANSVNGTPFKLTIDSTDVGNTDSGTTTTTAPHGTMTASPTAAGTYTLAAGDFTASLDGFDSSGGSKGHQDVPCVAPTDGSTTLKDSASNPATIAVSKDSSTTTSGAKYTAKTKVAKVHSKSVGSTYKLPGKGGKVVFTLFKKGVKLGTASSTANAKGVATAVFKGKKIAKKGAYVVKVAFKGNPGLKGSKSSTGFKVS